MTAHLFLLPFLGLPIALQDLAPNAWIQNAAPVAQDQVVGTAQGVVLFDGEVPEIKRVKVDPTKSKGCVHEGESVDDRDLGLIVDKETKGLANVVIQVEIEGAKVAVPEKALELDQKKCRFEPHVLLVPAGAKVDFKNSDGVSHNVHATAMRNESFNELTAPAGKYTHAFPRADRVQIKCDYHPWMSSWLVVVDTPYVAVTDAKGRFTIKGLPPGEHKLSLWQESLGKRQGSVTVRPDGGVDALEFKLAPTKKTDRKP